MLARFAIPALLAAGLVAPAQAQDPEHTAYVIVDESVRASEALMKHRIAVAVEQVCGSYASIESYQIPEVDSCRRQAWASANQQIARMAPNLQSRIALPAR